MFPNSPMGKLRPRSALLPLFPGLCHGPNYWQKQDLVQSRRPSAQLLTARPSQSRYWGTQRDGAPPQPPHCPTPVLRSPQPCFTPLLPSHCPPPLPSTYTWAEGLETSPQLTCLPPPCCNSSPSPPTASAAPSQSLPEAPRRAAEWVEGEAGGSRGAPRHRGTWCLLCPEQCGPVL